MTTTDLYEIATSEGDDGTLHPVERIWTPCADDPGSGFIAHRGLHVTGIDNPTDDHLYPVAFLLLGHHRWTDVIEAAAAYMARIHGWRNLHVYPGDDPSVLIPLIPRAVHTHGVFLRHPHPDHGCECEWGRHLAHGLGARQRARGRAGHRPATPRRTGCRRRHPQP
ncbi:hypothetical protein ACFCW4_33130 [Streptomyces virginiae]|uniref:hypothetical protein n=1 Tax=Streptomyces virginiae TaxID=1961 RepID=UPI0035D5D5F6